MKRHLHLRACILFLGLLIFYLADSQQCLISDYPSSYQIHDVYLCMDREGELLASKKAVIHRSVTYHVPTGPQGNSMDFDDGIDYIEKNVLRFKNCLRLINEIKVCNASNIVIGVCMGGVFW